MSEITRLLNSMEHTPESADALLPLVYEELRRLAARKLRSETPGQTLQATALVHEAYLRLVSPSAADGWDSRGHFFAAAAEAMRRILIENARRKGRPKHGGDLQRHTLTDPPVLTDSGVDRTLEQEQLLLLDEALQEFEQRDARKASVVKLRYFAGLTLPQVSDMLDISLATAERDWAYARAWLLSRLEPTSDNPENRKNC